MSDISKCNWEKCPIKKLCRRFKAKINPYRQSWIKWEYIAWKWCNFFLDNLKVKIVCAWCPDKEEKEKLYESQWYSVSHWICKKCKI